MGQPSFLDVVPNKNKSRVPPLWTSVINILFPKLELIFQEKNVNALEPVNTHPKCSAGSHRCSIQEETQGLSALLKSIKTMNSGAGQCCLFTRAHILFPAGCGKKLRTHFYWLCAFRDWKQSSIINQTGWSLSFPAVKSLMYLQQDVLTIQGETIVPAFLCFLSEALFFYAPNGV